MLRLLCWKKDILPVSLHFKRPITAEDPDWRDSNPLTAAELQHSRAVTARIFFGRCQFSSLNEVLYAMKGNKHYVTSLDSSPADDSGRSGKLVYARTYWVHWSHNPV
jgi:hypothetical protein